MPSSLRGAMLRLTPGPEVPGTGARRGRGRPLLCKLLLLLLLESVIALCGELGHRGGSTAPTPWEGSPNHGRVAPALGVPPQHPHRGGGVSSPLCWVPESGREGVTSTHTPGPCR